MILRDSIFDSYLNNQTMMVLAQNEKSSLGKDELNNTILLDWEGDISLFDFMKGLNMLEDDELNLYDCKIILDFSKVKGLSVAARLWFEDEYLNSRAAHILFNSKKLAIIRPISMEAEIIVNNMTELCEEKHPEFTMRLFRTTKNAIKWVSSNYRASGMTSFEHRLFGLFGFELVSVNNR
jgi:hypothetical protein